MGLLFLTYGMLKRVSGFTPPFRVSPGPVGIEPQLGIVHSIEEQAECLAVGAVRPGNDSPLEFGYVISVDRQIATGAGGDEPRDFFRHLAFGYAGRQASATEVVVNRRPLLLQLSSLPEVCLAP
jgi:hypothetical protein